MALRPGTRLGPYEVTAQIGVGGHGEVYQATDTRLKRQVAIKVLPAAVAADAERLSRFQREAEVLASLNHPNIAAIHGLEDTAPSPGVGQGVSKALVMELEGPTLADRIAEGPVPVDETLRIARQIAEALEAAHEQGIVHRDLKPANVKVRPDGTVKVLDFGLAKAMEPAGAMSPVLSQLPTITTPAMTQAGMILGTAAYMSPEQARGLPVDERADIWAFGCVLYEMLTGQRAFAGTDITETLASVLRGDPDWSLLPEPLRPAIRTFLRCCLHRDPRHRLHHIADMRLALEGGFDVDAGRDGAPAPAARPSWRAGLSIAAAVVVTAAVTAWTVSPLRGPADTPVVSRLHVLLPDGQDFRWIGRHLLALSPDGTRVAYAAGSGLWLQPLDRLEAMPVPGTEAEARSPFFSADGQSIGYYEEGEMRRVSVTGGAPVTVTDVANPWWGASWGADDTILYALGADGIWRVSADGGMPERVIAVEEGEQAHGPQPLPGGEWVLFTLLPRDVGSWNRAQIVLQSLVTGERVLLVDGGRDARYVPTGHLVYALSGDLLAAPFDLEARRLTRGAQPVVRGVFDATTVTGATHFDIAANGSLVYVPRSETALRLTWVDRNGREQAIPAEPRPYRVPRVSPDGTRIAVEVEAPGNTDVWVGDVQQGLFRRLTTAEDVDSHPIWTPDGTRIVYSAVRGTEGLFSQAVDGSGPAEHLTDGAGGVRAFGWTREGDLLYEELAGADVRVLPLEGRSPPRVITLFDAPEYFAEVLPALSPDGRWLAYQSAELGEMDVYVRPFPDVSSRRWQISVGGGWAPLWSPDGREIFYRSDTSLMAVATRTQPDFAVLGTPAPLFSLSDYVLAGVRGIRYDVAPDGRFLLLKDETRGGPRDRIVVVQHWFEELRRLVPQ